LAELDYGTASITLPAGPQTLTFRQDDAGWNLNYTTWRCSEFQIRVGCASLFACVNFIAAYARRIVQHQHGNIDVDYAGYLSKHDIVYNQPITNPVGWTVGNGEWRHVWSANGLTMQVGGVDTSSKPRSRVACSICTRIPDGYRLFEVSATALAL